MSIQDGGPQRGPIGPWARGALYVLAAVLVVGGLALLVGGGWLIALGGSWYFGIAGLALIASGGLIAAERPGGAWLYFLILIGTAIWAVWDSGLEFWPLVSRLTAPLVIGVFVALAAPLMRRRPVHIGRGPAWTVAAVLIVILAAGTWRAFQAVPLIAATGTPPEVAFAAPEVGTGDDWANYGHDLGGRRFVSAEEITPGNVGALEVAWTFNTGDVPGANAGSGAEDQNTPLQVGDTLYVCTVTNIVHALDVDTGEKKWTFDPEASSPFWQRCRGVSYYDASAAPAVEEMPAPTTDPASTEGSADATSEAPATPSAPEAPVADAGPQACATRIVMSTIDARLIELDSETGEPCANFGTDGTVDLKAGMGEVKPGFYFQTSAPTVAGDLIIIGGWVVDNVMVGEPSGVVRAFDARTGDLVWAWDMGAPDRVGAPEEGETYTRGTPNMWSTPAVDLDLGLVYIPTGNATPDFFGGHRSEVADAYNSSIVALRLEDGREAWKFQTVHHDVWDYDVPSQPALFDLPDGQGGTTPVLIQATKRGQIFMLDRATGEPVAEVEERPVPQGAVEGDYLSPTQPYSVGMPAIGAEPLSESRMWGATPFDQLWCRIQFRQMRYEGEFTPPGLTPSLQWPGYFGGMNWGSGTVFTPGGYFIINDTRSPHRVQLVPREEADAADAKDSHSGLSGQYGTPYGASKYTFMSPLGIPCQEPPYGSLTAIDLTTQQIAWQVPMGTVEDTGPLGIRMGMPIPVGMPTVGGPFSTASGLVFYAGTLDFAIRAMDVATGEVLWHHRLPAGSQGTPMSYVSPKTGRQFVVVSAGGARQSNVRGDHIIAFALPEGGAGN
ncbi:membrane-bound PQQ-dependent dehydrogenase, glucose/quinate/shikimate family [Pseudooceanicola sp. LIPI14-2-Ac024]|uniref:membrane-bound PQQ-dependent dehydrogenase, glucose/quinate/shikimate family n=1 Tax=Pseudooceanicola sp. LIPI14-2-Ac024 TaxID=3344875 RepID=UPI0035D0C0CB